MRAIRKVSIQKRRMGIASFYPKQRMRRDFLSSVCNAQFLSLSRGISLTNYHRSERKAPVEVFYRLAPSRVQIPFFFFPIQQNPSNEGFCCMADEEGFEPPIRVSPYKRFRVARIQPLCHSSVTINLIMIICSFGKYYLNTFTLFSIGSNVFSSAGSSLLPTGIWLISFHVGGKFHSLITASSINGL